MTGLEYLTMKKDMEKTTGSQLGKKENKMENENKVNFSCSRQELWQMAGINNTNRFTPIVRKSS